MYAAKGYELLTKKKDPLELELWTLDDHRQFYLRRRSAYKRIVLYLDEEPHRWNQDAAGLARDLTKLPGVGEALAFRFVQMIMHEYRARLEGGRGGAGG